MPQPDDQVDQQQAALEHLHSERSDLRNGDREDVTASWNPSTRNYPTVNIGGQAHAILGDVHIRNNDPKFMQDGGQQYHKRMLLRSLYFEGMSTRKAAIDARASSPRYVDWIWKTNFPAWLEGPESFYWITGRPGSGKSTLMTHISSSYRTKQALAKRGGPWKIVHFFFDFRAGQSLGNNIEGLLRSLLHQIVRQVPEAADCVDFDSFDSTRQAWTPEIYLDNLCNAIEASSCPICVFIDGLDEFEGSYSHLLDVIQKLGERLMNIKLCLASRPYLPFEDTLGGFAGVVMQYHNDESIRMYTSAQWTNHRVDHNAQLPQELGDRIRAKANGVFLWARLAVDELLVDFIAGKPVAELRAQLEEMPAEVEDMYQRILDRLSEPHQQEAAAILYLMLQATEPLSIDEVYAVLEALKRYHWAGEMIIPVDCDADNTRRVLAVLGDLIDESLSPEDRSYWGVRKEDVDCVPPRLTIRNSTVQCRRERVKCISLTHETLRSFLANSLWLASRISLRMKANAKTKFWIDLYLTEISLQMLAGERNHVLETGIRHSVVQYRSQLVGPCQKLPRPDDHTHEIELLRLLKLWPAWSPLLLHALQNLFERLSELEDDRRNLSYRIKALYKSAVFPLHTAICMFTSIDKYFRLFQQSEDPSIERNWWRGACDSQLQLTEVARARREGVDLGPFEAIVAICHRLEDFVPDFIAEAKISKDAKQLIFDFLWLAYIRNDFGSRASKALLRKTTLLQALIDTGCQLEGRHLCTYFYIPFSLDPPPFSDWTTTFISQNLSTINLSHAPGCVVKDEHLLGFVKELGHFWQQYWTYVDGSGACEQMLLALIDRGADLNALDPVKHEALLFDQIDSLTEWLDGNGTDGRHEIAGWLETLLEAGADPHLMGKSGDAFMALARFRDCLIELRDQSTFDAYYCEWSDCPPEDEDYMYALSVHDSYMILNLLEKYARLDSSPAMEVD